MPGDHSSLSVSTGTGIFLYSRKNEFFAAAKKAAEEASQNPETVAKKKMSIAERAHLAENLDDAPEEKDEK